MKMKPFAIIAFFLMMGGIQAFEKNTGMGIHVIRDKEALFFQIEDKPFKIVECSIQAVLSEKIPGMIPSASKKFDDKTAYKKFVLDIRSMDNGNPISLKTNIVYQILIRTDKKNYFTYFVIMDISGDRESVDFDYGNPYHTVFSFADNRMK